MNVLLMRCVPEAFAISNPVADRLTVIFLNRFYDMFLLFNLTATDEFSR